MTPKQFEQVYAAHGARLLRIATLVGGKEQAEDAVAEVFTSCWRSWQRVDPDDPGAYLRRSLLHEIARRGRRPDPSAIAAVPERNASTTDRLTIEHALADLPDDQRVVVVLRYLDDLSERQVAELLDLPVGTVKSRAARGLRRLEPVLRPTYEVADD